MHTGCSHSPVFKRTEVYFSILNLLSNHKLFLWIFLHIAFWLHFLLHREHLRLRNISISLKHCDWDLNCCSFTNVVPGIVLVEDTQEVLRVNVDTGVWWCRLEQHGSHGICDLTLLVRHSKSPGAETFGYIGRQSHRDLLLKFIVGWHFQTFNFVQAISDLFVLRLSA